MALFLSVFRSLSADAFKAVPLQALDCADFGFRLEQNKKVEKVDLKVC